MTESTSQAFGEFLQKSFDGEVYGEAIFAAMADATERIEHRYKLRVLEALERETKHFLARALEARGTLVSESDVLRKQGDEFGRKLVAAPWELFMKGLRPELVKFVAEFERAEALATTPADREVALHVTAHERALLAFVDRELAGQGAESPEPVLAMLVSPPQPPA